ncbi:probable serine/threonine-protein kinase PBL4 [Lolium rigidum]|uniref:probable serine/threonine-protein kinase PBL4 n=1 Tax=Lolium rigidum TaxID=89674 RepID=UPI001F5D3694|nr:probable serine/threonine-protein kinase PBL4 [Lolium rigidum]
MGNCMGGSAKCANASTPFASKVIPGSSTSNSKATQGSSSSSDGRKKATDEHAPAAAPPATATALKSFSTSDLRAATKNFGSSAYLGEGGFGCVYKGWIDEVTLAPARPGATNAMMVAIKKLKKESYQGHREWLTEVTFLGELHHDNLVKLVGYCSDSDSNKLLVYEYMLRGSLENHLFRRGSGNQPPLPWATRVVVAADVARGLAFLHSRDVIFRDLKSSNVLLDTDHRAKLSDFGLARAGPTGGKTHVSTRVVGTRGYAAPEYVATGHLSAKSDVYGFGVVLLELMTGKRALDESRGLAAELLVDWARPMLVGDKRKVIRVMDTRLGGQYNKKQAQDVAALALRCLNNDGRSRPTMAEVLPCLEQLLKENTTKSSSSAAARSATPVHRDHRRHTG